MPIFRKLIFLVAFPLIVVTSAHSQAVRSPFSTFGIGDVYGDYLIQNHGMGGMGVSQPQYWHVNNQNPALLVHNMVTVFQAGVVGESRTIRGDTLKEQNRGGNLNYLVTAFPIIPRNNFKTNWSTALGLMPYSTINYGLLYMDRSRDGDGNLLDTVNVRESGSGGLNQFYWSNGFSITKNLSLGVKAAYMFGPMETNYENAFANQTNSYYIQVKEKTSVKDFLFTLGVAYGDTIRRNYGYHIGGTYSPATRLNASRRAEILRFHPQSTQPVEGDTIFSRGGSLRIPSSATIGFSFFRVNRWMLGTEFRYQDWTQFEGVVADDEGLGESWRGAIGGEFTPDAFDDNILKRITYRVGLNYERYPFIVNSNQVSDFGINFGFSIPANRSSLDLAFKVGKRGDRGENIFEETYFKVYFGITFNDKWFIKRKFD
jgi:hypothetical protein